MSAVVLADASAWTYVGITYGAALGLIGAYAAWTLRRGRKANQQLPPDERTWT